MHPAATLGELKDATPGFIEAGSEEARLGNVCSCENVIDRGALPMLVWCSPQEPAKVGEDSEQCAVVVPVGLRKCRTMPEGDLREPGAAKEDVRPAGIRHEPCGPPRVGTHKGGQDDVRLSPLRGVGCAVLEPH